MSLWSPPHIEPRTVTRPAYGRDEAGVDVGEISAERLRILLRTLQDVIAAQVQIKTLGAPTSAVLAAQEAAAAAWFALLNASWPEAPYPLRPEQLARSKDTFSTEFYYLAEWYARALSHHSIFPAHHGIHLLKRDLFFLGTIMPLGISFSWVAQMLRRDGQTDLRVKRTGWRSATITWRYEAELARLPNAYHDDYHSTFALTYLTLFNSLPQQLKSGAPARSAEQASPATGHDFYRWDLTWDVIPSLLSWRVWLGIAVSLALSLGVLLSGALWLAWFALLPAAFAWMFNRQIRLQDALKQRESQIAEQVFQAQSQSSEMETISDKLQAANDALRAQVSNLTTLRDFTLTMGATLDHQQLLNNVIEVTTEMLHFDRAVVFVADDNRETLTFGAVSHPATSPEAQFRLEQLEIPLDYPDFPLLHRWQAGDSVYVEQAEPLYAQAFGWVFSLLEVSEFFSVPLSIGPDFLGVILVDNRFTKLPISPEKRSLLETLAANIGIAMENTRLYRRTDEALEQHVNQLNMMRQVDKDLNEALSWERVLSMTLDWGLRLTGAHGASLAMLNPDQQTLRIAAAYGLGMPEAQKPQAIPLEASLIGQVAQSGQSLIVNDLAQQPEPLAHTGFAQETKAFLGTPIRRRGSVIGVISLEHLHAGEFTEDHQHFMEQLSSRAAVAIENARLLEETEREREKLSSVLEKTADAVIVVGFDRRLILLNEAALAAFRLNPREDYTGQPFAEVFAYTALAPLVSPILAQNKHLPVIEEVQLEDERYFHTHIAPNEQVGWVIVLHDVTPFKETEQLKNELIATVSHDLKNPLSVINGYVELLSIYNELNERGEEFMEMIRRSIRTMRQLIDDLLDLAHIDAGLELKPAPVNLFPVIADSVMSLQNLADEKHLTVDIDVPENLPLIVGDEKRLRQIMVNLVSNAIKYTPPEGHIAVEAKYRPEGVMILVKDDGLGISPEDQMQIFERFYRVRRPETDGIEGTGLGLAIVKDLVEAHGGKIGLTSHLGEGTTFYFTLPDITAPEAPPENIAA